MPGLTTLLQSVAPIGIQTLLLVAVVVLWYKFNEAIGSYREELVKQIDESKRLEREVDTLQGTIKYIKETLQRLEEALERNEDLITECRITLARVNGNASAGKRSIAHGRK